MPPPSNDPLLQILEKASSLSFPDRIPLVAFLDGKWEMLQFVDEQAARELIKAHKVSLLHTKKRLRGLRLLDTPRPGDRIKLHFTSDWRQTKYSTDHELNGPGIWGNPENCWTLIPLANEDRGVFTAVLDSIHEACPLARVAEQERAEILDSCVNALSHKHARLLRDRYQHGMTFSAIAAGLKVSVSAVHQMHARVLPILKAELKKRGISQWSEI